MFSLCSSMKWAHLPNAGGLYDQDPVLLNKFKYIFSETSKHEAAEAKKKSREAGNKSGSTLGRSARSM